MSCFCLEASGSNDNLLRHNLARLAKFRTIDDTFMRQVFKDNLPLAERVLRIVTGLPDLKLTREETQRDLKRLAGSRSLALDVWGVDSAGTQYDLEIQRGDDCSPRRLRYHGSAMDVEELGPGEDFALLPERWVVFICEQDALSDNTGLRLYEYRRSSGEELGDGTHMLYVDASYRGDDELGSLMADFCQSDPDKIHDKLLRERVTYLKRNPKGVAQMCRISEEIYNEGVQQGMQQGMQQSTLAYIRHIVANQGVAVQEALEILGVPEAERPQYLTSL